MRVLAIFKFFQFLLSLVVFLLVLIPTEICFPGLYNALSTECLTSIRKAAAADYKRLVCNASLSLNLSSSESTASIIRRSADFNISETGSYQSQAANETGLINETTPSNQTEEKDQQSAPERKTRENLIYSAGSKKTSVRTLRQSKSGSGTSKSGSPLPIVSHEMDCALLDEEDISESSLLRASFCVHVGFYQRFCPVRLTHPGNPNFCLNQSLLAYIPIGASGMCVVLLFLHIIWLARRTSQQGWEYCCNFLTGTLWLLCSASLIYERFQWQGSWSKQWLLWESDPSLSARLSRDTPIYPREWMSALLLSCSMILLLLCESVLPQSFHTRHLRLEDRKRGYTVTKAIDMDGDADTRL